MNLARVEQYFAELLSRIEDRHGSLEAGYASGPLLGQRVSDKDAEWSRVILPPNLAIVGTVNMDESAHGFSRKVLDRAFTIELSEAHLDRWERNSISASPAAVSGWPVRWWHPKAVMLAELVDLVEAERQEIGRAIRALQDLNELLAPAQLQVGYRTRDEVALFLLHAREIRDAFVGRDGQTVDPLDLALQMKILPRIVGGSSAIRRIVLGMLGWAMTGEPLEADEEARPIVGEWESEKRPFAITEARYPRLAGRLCLMWERLLAEGYTSYWL